MISFPVSPMLPEETLPFTDSRFIFETKWDGIRCLAHRDGDSLILQSRNGLNMTASFPEILALGSTLPPGTILDGEMISLGPNGLPDFEFVMRRFNAKSRGIIERLSQTIPATYEVFDVLQHEGEVVINRPLEDRKGLLSKLELPPACRLTGWVPTEGERLFEAVRKLGLEGVVGKLIDSRYEPGKRSLSWRKAKNYRDVEASLLGFRTSPFSIVVGDPPRDVKGVLEHSIPQAVSHLVMEAARKGLAIGIEDRTVWLKPFLRCRVRISGVAWSGRFREPRFIGLSSPFGSE